MVPVAGRESAVLEPPTSAPTPLFMLLEAMMHELSNPVQAARTSLHLLQSETAGDDRIRGRVQKLDRAFERIASVVRSVQLAKDAALLPPTRIAGVKLVANLKQELVGLGLEPLVRNVPDNSPVFKVHLSIVPLLLAYWAASGTVPEATPIVELKQEPNEQWKLHLRLRSGGQNRETRPATLEHVAGYPSSVGEFVRAAGGDAFVYEDDEGIYGMSLVLPLAD